MRKTGRGRSDQQGRVLGPGGWLQQRQQQQQHHEVVKQAVGRRPSDTFFHVTVVPGLGVDHGMAEEQVTRPITCCVGGRAIGCKSVKR